ncbi:MAG: linear amide C-N hydrolase [Ignavibacteria bacterium]
MRTSVFILAISLLSIFQINILSACTTFCINTEDELVFGRNYDFMIGYGIVFVNKKNVIKTAFTTGNNPAEWVSKFGSVTFNQYGREFPTGGINEAGLVVELMWLDDTKYPVEDSRATTGGVLQWIQYQLDNCETVQEVIDSDKDIRIPNRAVPIHFLITDKYGSTASIEFLEGKLVSHSGETLGHPVLTNDTYDRSEEYFKSNFNTGGIQSFDPDKSSLNRFAMTCSMVKSYNKAADGNAVDFSFKILKVVSQGNNTKWSIVYDIKNMKVYFKTFDNDKMKEIDITLLDFNCITEVKMLDINSDIEGNVNNSFIDYTYESNRKLIEDSYSGVEFLKGITNEEKDQTARFPENSKCRSKSQLEYEDSKSETKITRTNEPPVNTIYILTGLVTAAIVIAGFKLKKEKRNT